MANDEANGREYWKWAGLGIEFSGVVALFFYFGHLADQRWQCEPWGIITGGAIGLAGGIYWLAKEGLAIMKQLDHPRLADKNKKDPTVEHRS